MPSQKIPLFGGIIAPVHNGIGDNPGTPAIIATPPDKALTPRGVQAYYEMHLWLITGAPEGAIASDNNEKYVLRAYPDGNPAAIKTIWRGDLFSFGGDLFKYSTPIKILDGYPIRGNVTIILEVSRNGGAAVDQYPQGVQVFGYYYRVGQGAQIEQERRYIGNVSPDADGLTQGIPLSLGIGSKQILHTFEENRIDEISLAFSKEDINNTNAFLTHLYFEDENNNTLVPNHIVSISQNLTTFNYFRDPQSVYTINKAVFGGGLPTLGLPAPHHISIEFSGDEGPVNAHGFFTRR